MGLFQIGPRPRAGWTSRTGRARRPWRHSGHDLPSTACVLGRGRVRVWSQVTWRERPGCGTSAALYTPDAFRTRSVRVPYAFRTRSVGICNTFRTSDDQRVLLASLRSVEIRNVLQIPTERVRNAYGTRTERVRNVYRSRNFTIASSHSYHRHPRLRCRRRCAPSSGAARRSTTRRAKP